MAQARKKKRTEGTSGLAQRIREQIVRSRAIDEAMMKLAQRGLVGMYAPAMGLEGHIYGALAALGPSDWIFGDPRVARVGLDRGQTMREWLAQMLGLGAASDLGHASPGEHSSRAGHLVSTSSLMGTQLGHAMGVGHAMRLRNENACALALFGPAAAATGDFHVAVNFAALYRTATIFYYCSSGDLEADAERIGEATMEARGEGYGIRVETVDGSDPLAVVACVTEAAERARKGEGPTLIDGRSSGDPLSALGGPLPEIAERTQVAIDDLVGELLAEGPPSSATLFAEVWAEIPSRLAEQRDHHLSHIARFGAGEID